LKKIKKEIGEKKRIKKKKERLKHWWVLEGIFFFFL
jgi:hypothetical protein